MEPTFNSRIIWWKHELIPIYYNANQNFARFYGIDVTWYNFYGWFNNYCLFLVFCLKRYKYSILLTVIIKSNKCSEEINIKSKIKFVLIICTNYKTRKQEKLTYLKLSDLAFPGFGTSFALTRCLAPQLHCTNLQAPAT